MGCRPSRRAVACVRVAGEGPWGLDDLPAPAPLQGLGVRLRHRSSRHSRDEGRTEGGGGCNPRDRYSAPPVDRQFPPHSCTSATYEHGCCGTSRITLRLSKNGSTLEIEKCDFHHSVKSCHLCGTAGSRNAELLPYDIPLRTQSAPDLSVSRSAQSKPLTSPPSSQHSNKQVVNSESHPPPIPPRHMNRLPMVKNSKGISPRGSVCTTTKIDVDVESRGHSHQSSRLSVDNGFHDIDTYPVRTNTPTEIHVSHDSTKNYQRVRPEKLHTFKKSPHSKSPRSDVRRYDAQVQSENFIDYSYSYSPSSEDLCKLLRDTEHLLMSDYVGTETVDLTKLDSTDPGICGDDGDIDCPTRQDESLLKICVNEREGEASGCLGLEMGLTCPCINSMNGHNNETDGTDVIDLNDCGDSKVTPTNRKSSITGMITPSKSGRCHSDGQFVRGATDYRIRMLGAQKCEITSHLADIEAFNYGMNSTVPQVSDGKMILASCDDQVSSRANSNRVISDLTEDHVTTFGGSETHLSNGNQVVQQPRVQCKDGQMAKPVASLSGMGTKMDFCELTEQSCVLDENGRRIHPLQELEMSSTFFEADV